MEAYSASAACRATGLTPVEDFTIEGWAVEQAAERARFYCERLELGDVLVFERTPFALPEEERRFLAGVRQSASSFHKNISYRADRDRMAGAARGSADPVRLHAIMRAYGERVAQFAAAFLLLYAGRWRLDFTSFRPFEEQGRELSARSRNDLLHVDAFPTRPTNGGRLLRVFSNVNFTKPRIWVTTEPFEALAGRFAPAAGLYSIAAGDATLWRRARRALAGLLRSAGIPLPDRSPYDRFMLGFHDYLKANEAFQLNSPKQTMEFPPGSTWIAFTDALSHAVCSGQFALEQTLVLPCEALMLPERAPLRILERMCGKPLTRVKR